MAISRAGAVLVLIAGAAGCTSSIGPLDGLDETASASGGCGLSEYSDLVGQEVSVLNDANLPENRRVLFPGAAVTDEPDASRLNITIGTDDKISQVYCG